MISKVISLITKQLKQKKKLLLKSLFIFMLGFSFLPQQSYFSVNEVYAATDSQEQTQKDKLTAMDTFMEAISDIAFVLLWPLVALAGLAMDNSLIYGSFMGLDVSLWNVWQIVRSFANYTLGFMFLFGILYWNFSGKTGIKNIKLPDLLKKILLASVLIQASWFIMMVLVDLSTIMTYGIGGLPYSIMNEEALGSTNDTRMFKMNVDLDLGNYHAETENNGDLSSAVIYYWDYSGGHIAPCETVQAKNLGNDESQWFIVGREFASFSGFKMDPSYCMYYGALVSFNDFSNKEGSGYLNYLSEFKKYVEKGTEAQLKELAAAGIIYPLGAGKVPYLSGGVPTGGPTVDVKIGEKTESVGGTITCDPIGKEGGTVGVVSSKKKEDGKSGYCLYDKTDVDIGKILNKANSMTGPFSALYSSMSVYSNLKTKGLGIWQKFVVTFINTCFAVMLILPLIALVVVLFARIGLLWIAIALSPFIVLINVFSDVFKLPDSLNKYLNFGELIKLLLAPVLISFAVGISLVFMKTLQNAVGTGPTDAAPTADQQKFQTNMSKITGMTVKEGEIDYLGFIKIKMDSALLNFSRLLTMLFGLGITWFILFWAIKQTAVGKDVGQKLQDLGETALSTTPIIPIGKNGLSWSGIKSMPDQVFQNYSTGWKARSDAGLKAVLGDDSGDSNYDKQMKVFFDNENTSFDEAFGLSDADYANTGEMIKRMNIVVGHTGWDSKAAFIGPAYNKMLESAKTKADMESIVNHLNSSTGVTSNKGVTDKIAASYKKGNETYQLTLNNGKYELK